MDSMIGPIVLGLFITALGIANMRGNIASLHWYHRQRVKEEDRLPFARLVGSGTIIIGVALVLFGCLASAAEQLQNSICTTIGSIIVVIGIISGLSLSFYAMMKYNKGIF